MSSTLISNPYEQWVHTYLTVASEPIYRNPDHYESAIAYNASIRGLYPLPKPDNRTIQQEGWVSFVKGIMSIYTISDFRTACTKAKEVLRNPQELKKDLALWTTPCQAEEEQEKQEQAKKKDEALQCIQTGTLDRLRKSLEEAKVKESKVHDDLWFAEASEEEAIADYDRMKKDLEQQEEIMKEMIQARKDADKAYIAAQKEVEGCKKALELVLAANEPKPEAPAILIPSCYLPFTDNAFKPLKLCNAILNPGTYYIGDPCYPLGKSWIYKKAWEDIAYRAPAYFHSGRGCIVVGATAWGDGAYHAEHEYKDDEMPEYHVDSGTISIISVALIHDEVKRQKKECEKPQSFERLTRGGHIHTFDDEVEVHFRCGIFDFSCGDEILCINTEGCDTCNKETDDEDEDDE